MPRLDGYQLCRQLKARSATRDIPIIFMTAHDSTVDRVKCFEVGGMDYIAKPFQVEEVLARVRHQITICSLRAQLEQKMPNSNSEYKNARPISNALTLNFRKNSTNGFSPKPKCEQSKSATISP